MQKTAPQKKVYAKASVPWIRAIVSHKLGALLVHWVFQGLLYMDPTERWFKLALDALLTAGFGALLNLWMPLAPALVIGFLIAHTLNFLFNGQVYGVLKHFGSVHTSWEDFQSYVDGLKARIDAEPAIAFAAAYGSLAREAWSTTSDLDLRLVRKPGLANGLRVCWFALVERARAFVQGFPLDLFVLDSRKSLKRMSEKAPVVLGGSEAEEAA